MKPLEFWVIPDDKYNEDSVCVSSLKNLTASFHKDAIHVIEYSAYRDLKVTLKQYEHEVYTIKEMQAKVDALTEQNKAMREALEMCKELQEHGLVDFKVYGLTCDADILSKIKEALAKCGSSEPTNKETK